MDYSIIIPYHSGKQYLTACIDSLIATIPNDIEIVIVANNSNPDERVINLPNERCNIIKIDQDLFYPKAINLGVEHAKGDFLIFCDADTYYISGWFESLTAFYHNQTNIGFAGSKLLNPSDETIIDFGIGFTAFNSPHPFKGRNKDFRLVNRSFRAQATCSANSMIQKKLFENMGGFEEKLVHAYSDIDLCLRLKEKGLDTWCVHNSMVFHKGNSTKDSGMSKELKSDTKGQYMALNAQKISIDMDKYYAIASDDYISNGGNICTHYYLIDFATIADKNWHYNVFEQFLSIKFSDIYNFPYKIRDAKNISLYEIMSEDIRRLCHPILYFVDDFCALKNNTIWKYLRDCKNDLVIDRNANIIPFNHL